MASVILGLVAALLGLLIGPAMQVLLGPPEQVLTWNTLLGPVWASWIQRWAASDGISAGDVYQALPWVLLCVATAKSLLTFWQWFTWEWLGENVAFQWRTSLVDAFINVSPSARDEGAVNRAEAELGGLISQDIRTCRDYVVHFFGGLPREGMQVLFMALSLALLSPRLFIIFVFCVAPVGILLSRLGKKLRRRASRALEDNSTLGEWIQQRLLGLETIKQYRTETRESDAMKAASHRLYDGFLRAARLKARTSPLIECLGVTAMAVALGVAFRDIASGAISGAVAMSFFSSLALLAQGGAKLGRYFNSNREGVAAADRIFAAIESMREAAVERVRPAGDVKPAVASLIALKNVALMYGDKVAVRDFNFEFKAGKVYCVVGESGAGKSSVFNAILGLRPVSSGQINYFYGPSFESRSLDIAYMPQQVPVIPGQLAENVAYPRLTYDPDKVGVALETVGFAIDKGRMDAGIRTHIGASGLTLSGGQVQRLQLARLVYHHAPFVLVDEGTSALDPEMEKVVLTHIRSLAGSGAVVIMIAHRRAAVEFSDETLVLDDGRLVASGATAHVIKTEKFLEVFRE
jgi:subfamily B ATP-binding cassette protein MsbA